MIRAGFRGGGCMVASIRDKARGLLLPLEHKVPIKSNEKPEPNLFKWWTGVDQTALETSWKGKSNWTTCNLFVNKYSDLLGGVKLGAFELEDHLTELGMHRAWVRSTPDNHPNFGDVVRYEAYHVDVAMDYGSGLLWRMAAGQGGPRMGYDMIDKITSHSEGKPAERLPYNWSKVKGWVDIEIMFPQVQPSPEWVQGYWQIVFPDSGDTYYYYFDINRTVKWSAVAPYRLSGGIYVMGNDGGIGTYESANTYDTNVNWRSGTFETYSYDPNTDTMNGMYRGDPTVATRFQ
jgi:hypothetical protein